MNLALLIGLLAAYFWYVRGGGVATETTRIARYRRWIRRAPPAFGAGALLALALGDRLDTLVAPPPEFAAAIELAHRIAGFRGAPTALMLAVLIGFGGGAAIGMAIALWRKRRGKRQLMAGKLAAILPRTRTEIGWTALLAIVAGVIEELYFRLALPLFVTLATGNALAGFALAALLFAFAHRYQGWVGMAFATVAGALLAILYLATGSLWFAMLIHALLNLNGLVLRPGLLGQRPAAP